MKMLFCYFLLFLGPCQSAILRSRNLQIDISSRFLTPQTMEKAKLADKSWVDVGKVFEKITPQSGLFKYRDTDEIIFETEGSFKDAFELSGMLTQNEANRVIIQALIEENDWNKLFFILISRMTNVIRNFVKALVEIVNVDTVDVNQQTSLHLATKYKELDLIEILLERSKAEIDAKNSDSETPLMIAAYSGHYDSVEMLLVNGADPNLKDQQGRTSLHFAAEHNKPDLIKILLKYDAKIDEASTDLETPLMVAVRNGYTSSMKVLLTSEANVNAQRWDGKTALHLAAYFKASADGIHLLVKFEAKIDAVDEDLETPLIIASRTYFGYNHVIKALLAHGADPNNRNKDKKTALHFAAEMTVSDAVQILLTKGADIDALSDRSETPLMLAARIEKCNVMRILLKNEAKVNLKNADGNTALHLAASRNEVDAIQMLLDQGAEIDATNNNLVTPLMNAAENENPEAMNTLLRHNPNCKLKNKWGTTALHLASSKDHPSIGELIADKEVDIDATDTQGETPLMCAARKGNHDAMNALLNHNANPKLKNKCGETALYLAAIFNDVPSIERLLNHGAEIDAADNILETPLMRSAREGSFDVMSNLLSHNSNPTLKNIKGETALHLVVHKNHVPSIEILLMHGAEVDAATVDHLETPLMLAAKKGKYDAMNALLSRDANPKLKNKIGQTALHFAALYNHVPSIEILLNHGAEIDAATENLLETPLMRAVKNKNWDVMNVLLSRDANPKMKNSYGETALHFAALYNHGPSIEVLLIHGAEVDAATTGLGETPLKRAVKNGSCDAMNVLLSHNANANLKNKYGETALYLAVSYNKVPTIEILLTHGAEIDATYNGETTLMIATKQGNYDAMNALLTHDANSNLKNKQGATALHLAVTQNQVRPIELLLKHGAEIDETDSRLETPLMRAVKNGNWDAMNALLSRKANPDLKNKQGETALHLAVAQNHVRPIELLLNHGAEIDETDNQRETPLMRAVKNGNWDAMNALLSRKTNPNLKNKQGETALHLAVSSNYFAELSKNDSIEILLNHGAEINETDNELETPLIRAVRRGNRDAMNALLSRNANPNLKNKFGETALHFAVSSNNEASSIEILLNYGAEIDVANNQGQTPLMRAARLQHFRDAMNAFLGYKSTSKINKASGRTSLHLAASSNHVHSIEILLNHGAKIDETDDELETPLMNAAENGNCDAMNALLSRKADPNLKNKFGETALHFAVSSNDASSIEILLNHGAKIDAADNRLYLNNQGETPLMRAAKIENREAMKAFLNYKANSKMRNECGKTALHLAVSSNHIPSIEILLTHGAEIDATDNHEATALMIAAEYGSCDALKVLLKHGAAYKLRDKYGDSSLHSAMCHNRIDVIGILLEHAGENHTEPPFLLGRAFKHLNSAKSLLIRKANSKVKGFNGKRTLYLDVSNSEVNEIKILLKNAEDVWSKAPLINAVYAGDSMDVILCDETNPNLKDEYGWTALHYVAAAGNRVDLIKLLMKLGANVGEFDHWLKTPFVVAVLHFNFRSAKFLFKHQNYIRIFIFMLLIPLLFSFLILIPY